MKTGARSASLSSTWGPRSCAGLQRLPPFCPVVPHQGLSTAGGRAQVEKEVQKAMRLLGDLDTELGHKKEASRRVKQLQGQLTGVQQEGDAVEAQLRSLRAKSERLALWTSQHEHQVGALSVCTLLPGAVGCVMVAWWLPWPIHLQGVSARWAV